MYRFFLKHCTLTNKAVGSGWMAVVAPADRPKSVRNSCVIERICSVFVSFHLMIVCHLRVFVIRFVSDLFPILFTHNFFIMKTQIPLVSGHWVKRQCKIWDLRGIISTSVFACLITFTLHAQVCSWRKKEPVWFLVTGSISQGQLWHSAFVNASWLWDILWGRYRLQIFALFTFLLHTYIVYDERRDPYWFLVTRSKVNFGTVYKSLLKIEKD